MLSMKGDNKLQLGWEHNYRLRFKDFDKKYGFTKKTCGMFIRGLN